MDVESQNAAVALAGARSAAYGLVASGFRYPDALLLGALGEPARWNGWPKALDGTDADVADALDRLRRFVGKLRSDTQDASRETLKSLQAAYDSLFGHTVRGQCPPYEMEYGQSEIIQRASELADLGGFYGAFGLELGGDRPDSVCVECEFMSTLCAKEAYGLGVDDGELLFIVRQAQRDFLRDHLGFWLPAFARRVPHAGVHAFYDALAHLTLCFIAGECRRYDIDLGPALLELRPTDVDAETSIECGNAAVCEPTGVDRVTPLTIHGK